MLFRFTFYFYRVQRKHFILILTFFILASATIGFFLWIRSGKKGKEETAKIVPQKVTPVNQLAQDKRPFVQLVPHPDPARCDGITLLIDNLKNNETLAEYELEYMAGPLIQGVFGRRDFTERTEHKPLELGSCSKGKCKCDTGITGGSLTLRFTAQEDYTLKGDFSYQTVGDVDGIISSRNAKLTLKVGNALPNSTTVIVASTFGLPSELEGEIVTGPYGIFAPEGITPSGSIELTLQTKEEKAILYFWNGNSWQKLSDEVKAGKISGEISDLGVAVLVKES